MAHRAFGIYAHITWHTRLWARCIRRVDVRHVVDAVQDSARRLDVHVHEIAVLTDHVHVVASFRPDRAVAPFVRHGKSESSRRINLDRGRVFQWARGYYLESLSRNHVRATCAYVATQHRRHPDRIPS
jgi:REP element-mobilizing transposase RayT